MMEANYDVKNDERLFAAGTRLLEAAMDYWKEAQRATGGSGVVWLADSDGRMVIMTRGEYRGTLMQNIDTLREDGPVKDYDGEQKKAPSP